MFWSRPGPRAHCRCPCVSSSTALCWPSRAPCKELRHLPRVAADAGDRRSPTTTRRMGARQPGASGPWPGNRQADAGCCHGSRPDQGAAALDDGLDARNGAGAARRSRRHDAQAYAPYSRFAVGAAVLDDQRRDARRTTSTPRIHWGCAPRRWRWVRWCWPAAGARRRCWCWARASRWSRRRLPAELPPFRQRRASAGGRRPRRARALLGQLLPQAGRPRRR